MGREERPDLLRWCPVLPAAKSAVIASSMCGGWSMEHNIELL